MEAALARIYMRLVLDAANGLLEQLERIVIVEHLDRVRERKSLSERHL